MAVEFSKLTEAIRALGEAAERNGNQTERVLDELIARLRRYSTDWSHIDLALQKALGGLVDKQKYRAARPLGDREPLAEPIDPPAALPAQATLISVDGSQALSTRHDAYQYYLINIGGMVYHHGAGRAPEEISEPALFYIGDENATSPTAFSSGSVSIQRDMAEAERLARHVWQRRHAAAPPLIALLDQRLQYWPIGLNDAAQSAQFVQRWIEAMENIAHCGAWLLGYIERPETGSVITLLETLVYDRPEFDAARLHERPLLTDALLYGRVLGPGQRSCVYSVVNESTSYQPFMAAGQEICFFYLRPPGAGDVTRVDLPLSVAQQPEAVAQIHALLVHQCRIAGGYPYILTRADEIAVVQRSDQEYLEHLILLELARHGIMPRETGKQAGKDATRSQTLAHRI